MTTSLRVPVSITEEAAAHVAALGQQTEFERMLDKVGELVPELARVEVSLNPPYDTGDEPGVLIDAFRDGEIPFPNLAYDVWRD